MKKIIRLTEGDLVKLINRVIGENYFDSSFYLKNIKSLCKDILSNIENYKKVLKKMPKSFKSKYIREDYFRKLLETINLLMADIGRLNSNIQSLFGVKYSLSDYLNESDGWHFLQRHSNEFIDETDKLKDFILEIESIFDNQELDDIKRFVINICAKLIDYKTLVENYFDFIRLNQNIIDVVR